MRTIIAGSRGVLDLMAVEEAVAACGWLPSVVLSGTARGADVLGEQWAEQYGIPVERYPANWDQYGKRAGYIRNERMAKEAEALIALWNGESRGTQHMIKLAAEYGLRVFVYRVDRK